MHEATLRQIDAARPGHSTWLSANAGSGKTKVLTDRVARLLLNGAQPQRILCLTYTKAAASEMQNRLFAGLGQWAMLDDARLSAALADLGEVPAPDLLPRARRLFARAIETPGGLKIQTIHAFCAGLLRRFPLEAGVAPDFREVEPRDLHLLHLDLLDRMATGPHAALLQDMADVVSEAKLDKVLAELSGFAAAFRPGAPVVDLHALLGLPPGYDRARLLADVFLGAEGDLARALLPLLQTGKPSDATLGRALEPLLAGVPGLAVLEGLEKALLTGSGAKEPYSSKAGTIPTKDLRESLPDPLVQGLNALCARVETVRTRRLALLTLERAQALHGFARHWLPALDAAKAAHGWLDFDDLITRAERLLSTPETAQWVLFKLDGGIDHILVDEAQDTSPRQWRVIERLTQEFTAGQGARDIERTVFVVGDKKQSIYSFQGADLRGFDRMRDVFAANLAAVDRGLNRLELTHSFRSSAAVLRAVDMAFAPAPGSGNGLGGGVEHLAFHAEKPGRVDLWPALPKAADPEPGDWMDPVDRPSETNHDTRLAGMIAAEIRALLDRGEQITVKGVVRPVHAGDVLILVRRRKRLFHEIIRACKALDLPIAGADRLTLAEELPVQDLIAALRFLALPEDDLSLACLLRSPLFGWSEDRLFRLAHGRPRSLWEALRDAAPADTLPVLTDLLGQTDFLRPYDLLERLLTRHDGRRRMLARFGPEAEEAIEAFIGLALRYEEGVIPSLDGFLAWIDASDAEIKRQVDSAGQRVRVMTVHGAKGLEAPVVFLPDCADRKDDNRAVLFSVADVPLVRLPKPLASVPQQVADQASADARTEESDRLLYVALTRAQSWLVVAAAGEAGPESWHGRMAVALGQAGGVRLDTPAGPGLRLAHGGWPDPVPQPAAPTLAVPSVADLLARPPRPPVTLPPLSPSQLGGAKTLPGPEGLDEGAAAMARGTALHRLLEYLPDLPTDADPALLAEVRALLAAHPALFGPDALAEVALTGPWRAGPGGRAVRNLSGVIDRLLVDEVRVLAVDFKSNRTVPASADQVPDGLLRQMGAYAHLLGALYPRHRIETALLWTATAQLMLLPPALTTAALGRALADLDPDVPAS